MAHRVDDLNYITDSGQRRFKDSPIPGTTFSANMANMFQEEIVRTVEAAGLTPAASAAADQAAGWSQLIAAVRVLSNLQLQDSATFPHTSITAGANITPPILGVALGTFIRLGGSFGPGNITLAENDGNYANKLIFVENDGTEINHIGSTNHRVRIEPGKMAIFKYDANRASGSKWVPVMVPNNTDNLPEGSGNLYYTVARVLNAIETDEDIIDAIFAWIGNYNSSFFDSLWFDPAFAAAFPGAFAAAFPSTFATSLAATFSNAIIVQSMELRQTRLNSLVDTANLRYKVHNGLTHVEFPFISCTINESDASPTGLRFSAPSNAVFPTALRMDALMDRYDDTFERSRWWVPVQIIFNGVREIGSIRPSQVDGYWALFHENGSADWSTDNNNYELYVSPLNFSFFGGV